MRKPEFYSAVFGIIKNEKGKILFQKRQNTGFRDGLYQLPSGHLEGRETMKESLIRELEEEINIKAKEEDLEILHISHVICPDRVYFNIYIKVLKYFGELNNNEIEKCSELVFKSYEEIKDNPDFKYEVETLENIFNGDKFSEKLLESV